jgi:hypothetical protein
MLRSMEDRLRIVVSLVLSLGYLACDTSSRSRTEKALAELQQRKELEAKTKREEKLAPLPGADLVALSPPYNDSSSALIVPDGPCPEGLWSLFGGDVPGGSKEEKQANLVRQKSLADGLKDKQFLVRLRGPGQVTLREYDAPKGEFPLEVIGTIDCTDSAGRIALAWTEAKATDPGASAAQLGVEITQNVWTAPPVVFALAIKSQVEAKEFKEKNALGLSARVVFKLGKAEIDRKLKKIAKVSEKAAGETLGYGGGVEDWGAGRLLHVSLVGIRVAAEREKRQLFEQPGAAR